MVYKGEGYAFYFVSVLPREYFSGTSQLAF
jgi:hypothetical protein